MLKPSRKLTDKELKREEKAAKYSKLSERKQGITNSILKKVFTEENNIESLLTITLKITANNTFCSLAINHKLILISSAGKYKINITKRKLKYHSKFVIERFFAEIENYLNENTTLINLKCPKNLRKNILKIIYLKFQKKSYLIKIKELKCFNGCRSKKQKRKKRGGLKIFK